MTGPFGDIEREAEEERARHLGMAEALDSMEEDVDSQEADFLESVLRRLRDEKRTLTEPQARWLEGMHEKYGLA